jgi:hypothetical protein
LPEKQPSEYIMIDPVKWWMHAEDFGEPASPASLV